MIKLLDYIPGVLQAHPSPPLHFLLPSHLPFRFPLPSFPFASPSLYCLLSFSSLPLPLYG